MTTTTMPITLRPSGMVRHGLYMVFVEGMVAAALFNVLENWLVPLFQNRLGASAVAAAWAITTVPMFGSMIAGIGAARIIHLLGGPQRTLILGSLLQVACLLACIPSMIFPNAPWSLGLALSGGSVACLLNGICSAAWLTWMGELVPRSVQGRYFGTRSRAFYIARLSAALLLAGVVAYWPITHEQTAQGWWGPVAILLIGAAARTGSALLFAYTPVPPHMSQHLADIDSSLKKIVLGLWEFIRTSHRTAFGRWVLLWSAIQFGITLPGQFLTYFMSQSLEQGGLGLTSSPLMYSLLLQVGIIMRLLLFPLMGQLVDRFGPKNILRMSFVGMTIASGSWAFTNHLGILLVNEIFFNIFATAAECAILILQLSCSTNAQERARFVGYQQTMLYASMMAASCLGAAILSLVPSYDGSAFRTLFIIGLGLRLPVVIIAWRLLR